MVDCQLSINYNFEDNNLQRYKPLFQNVDMRNASFLFQQEITETKSAVSREH